MMQPDEDSQSNEHKDTDALLNKENKMIVKTDSQEADDPAKEFDADTLNAKFKGLHWSWLHIFVYISFGGSVLVAFASAFFYIITDDSMLKFMSFAIILVTTWFGTFVGIIAVWKGTTLHQIKFKLKNVNSSLTNLISDRQTNVNALNRESLHFAQMNDKLRVKWMDLKNENNEYKNQNKRLQKANEELESITDGLDETLSFCPLIQRQLKEQDKSINSMQKMVSLFEEIKKYYNKVYLLEIYYKYRKSRQGDAKTMNLNEWADFIKALDKHSKKDAELRKIYYKWNPDALDHFKDWQLDDENNDQVALNAKFKYYHFNKSHLGHLEDQDYMEASVFRKNFPKSTYVFECLAKGNIIDDAKADKVYMSMDQKESYAADNIHDEDEKESDDNTISICEFEKEVEAIFNDTKVCFWSTVHDENSKSKGKTRSRRGTIS